MKPEKNVLVLGASRGIGLEFVRQHRADGHSATGTARDESGRSRLRELGATALALDVGDEASCTALFGLLEGQRFKEVVLNAGVSGPDTSGLSMPSEADFDHIMHTNVLGPMRLLSLLGDVLAPGAHVVAMSSIAGSIGMRQTTRYWQYRASKAALNSVMKDAAIALRDRAIVVCVHPGRVHTDMTAAMGAEIDVGTSVAAMRTLLAGLTPEHSGRFFSYDGAELSW